METERFWEIVKSDYSDVLFRLACATSKKDGKAVLLFGSLEFFPPGNGASLLECGWQTIDANNGYRYFFRRILMNPISAIDIYEKALSQPESILETEEIKNTIIHGTLIQSTIGSIPYLANYETLPFLPMQREAVRLFSAYPADNEKALDIAGYKKICPWLKDRLCFDMVEDYPEFAGSLHCIFYNPIYKRLGCRLVPGSPESVQFTFEPFRGRNVSSLSICMSQQYPHGYVVQKPSSVADDSIRLKAAAKVWKTGYMVWDEERGFLDFSQFHGFIRGIVTDISVVEGKHRVTYDNGKQPIDVETAVSRSVSKFEIKEDGDGAGEVDAGERILQNLAKRRKKKEAEKLGQFICRDNDEAKEYIRSLFATARSRLIIIDPYFDDSDAVYFLGTFERLDIAPQIYVSANSLSQKADVESQAWHKLLHVVEELAQSVKAQFFVMPGMGKFHDRFFIVDDKVYLSGNSLNNIGSRLSAIIRLPDGDPVLAALLEIQDKVKELRQWVSDHLSASKGQENGETDDCAC